MQKGKNTKIGKLIVIYRLVTKMTCDDEDQIIIKGNWHKMFVENKLLLEHG